MCHNRLSVMDASLLRKSSIIEVLDPWGTMSQNRRQIIHIFRQRANYGNLKASLLSMEWQVAFKDS